MLVLICGGGEGEGEGEGEGGSDSDSDASLGLSHALLLGTVQRYLSSAACYRQGET
jgi:hypothetical protein